MVISIVDFVDYTHKGQVQKSSFQMAIYKAKVTQFQSTNFGLS